LVTGVPAATRIATIVTIAATRKTVVVNEW
jgi:hypothetical protein